MNIRHKKFIFLCYNILNLLELGEIKMNHCVVGDVHGEYQALLNLIAKTPLNSTLIFVGDLVDRGAESARVVQLIRQHKLACVRGNHEEMMIEFGSQFIENIKNNRPIAQDNIWLNHGGVETLLSYGLISIKNNEMIPHPFIKDFIFQFEDDIEWMKRLPLYIELEEKHSSGRKVVISHSAIAGVWDLRDESESFNNFKNTVLWGRTKPVDSVPIFNVFGHTPQRFTPDTHHHYVNIDTGAYKKGEKGFGLLSAYCIESGEIFSSTDVSYAKVS